MKGILLFQLATLLCLSTIGQIEVSNLAIEAQEDNVLRYNVSFETNEDAFAWLDYYRIVEDSLGVADTLWNHTPIQGPAQMHNFTVYELVQDNMYNIKVNAFNVSDCYEGAFDSFVTDTLPAYVAEMDSVYINPEADLDGYYFTNGLLTPETYQQIFNRKGEVVWYDTHSEEAGLGLASTCKGWSLTPGNDRIALECHELRQEDLLGNEIAHVDYNGTDNDTLFFHHDAILNAANNYVAIASRLYTYPSADSTISVIEEGLLEFDADGQVIWSWFAFDYFDPTEAVHSNGFFIPIFGTDAINWLHANTVYQDTDGNYIVSFKEIHQLIKINADTGAIMWKLGGVDGDIQFVPEDAFGDQHAVNRTPVGTYILFDNTGLDSLSRIMEFSIEFYDIPEAINQWEWALPQENFSNILGSAVRIAGGNRYALSGNTGSIFEVNSAGEVQWHLRQNLWSYRTYLIDEIFDNAIEDITLGNNPELMCVNEIEIELMAEPQGGYWSGSGVANGMFSPDDAGLGTHTLTYKWGWNTATIDIEVSDQVPPCVVNIEELTADNRVDLFPNPTSGLLNITFADSPGETANYTIYNTLGSRVETGRIVIGSQSAQIDVSHLESGSYHLVFVTDDWTSAQTFVVE